MNDDIISRQAAIDALVKYTHLTWEHLKIIDPMLNVFEKLPSAERHGRWVMDENPHDGDCRCSACTIAIDQMHERNHGMLNSLTGGKWWTFYRYCPNCGARMDLDEAAEE